MRPSLPALFHHMRVSRCCLCSDLLNADFAVLNMTTLGTRIRLIMWKGIMSGPRVLADVLRKKRRHLLKVFTINHEKTEGHCLSDWVLRNRPHLSKPVNPVRWQDKSLVRKVLFGCLLVCTRGTLQSFPLTVIFLSCQEVMGKGEGEL